MKWQFTRRRLSPALAAAALAFSACSDSRPEMTAPETDALFAKPSAGGPYTGPVRTTLADNVSYASDGLGEYKDAVSGVESVIYPTGNFGMSTMAAKSTRRVRLSFAEVDSGTVPFTGTQVVSAGFISNISLNGATYPGMKYGDIALAPLATSFTYGGKNYRLAMNPNTLLGAGTEWAQATCIASLSATDPTCKTWQLVPTGANGMNTSRLILIGTNNSETPVAVVRVSFQITFSR